MSEVIKWFQNIKNKKLHTFTVFDIQEFYPSIGEKLLKDAILFAQTHANISRKDHYCFIITSHGLKKIAMVTSMSLWEVTTEQKCLSWLAKDNIGLYRDDGLSVFKNYNGHQNDKVRKKMTDLFK